MKRFILLVVLSVAVIGSSWGQSPDPVNNPVSWWHTFLGGTNKDWGVDVATDNSGYIYVTGTSEGTWGSPIRPFGGHSDAFVAKFDSSGALQWNTFLGQSIGDDYANGICIDGNGNVYVTGYSYYAWGSPVRPFSVGPDAFVAKINASGALQWNTFMGGSIRDFGQSIAVDGSGNIYVAGYGESSWGTPLNSFSGGRDVFVARLNASGVLQWNSFVGGVGNDYGDGIAIDAFDGSVYVRGHSDSAWGNPVNPYNGANDNDAFVAKFNANGIFQWHTFLVGGGYTYGGIAVDGDRNIYAISWDSWVSFCSSLVHVTKLNWSGYSQWVTSWMGRGPASDVTVDSTRNVYVTGTSYCPWGSPQDPFGGGNDAFVARLNANGVLQWHTFLGGANIDLGYGITADSNDNVYIAGMSASTWGTPVNPWTGLYDGFLTKIYATPFLKLASPNGGETFPWGSKQNVTWDSDDIQANVKLVLFKDGVKVGNIVTDLPITPGSYTWTVGSYIGGTVAAGTGYSVRVITMTGVYSDNSDAAFAITPLRLVSPNGYENWQINSVHPITWTAPGLSGTVKLVLFKDTVKIGNIVTDLPAGSGSYSWTIPSGTGAVGTGYWVRVITMDGVYRDESDAHFSITAQSQLRITSPNGGEVWPWHHFMAITWTNGSYTGNVKLVLFKNGVKLGNIVTDIPANSSPFNWEVGNYIGGAERSGEGYSIRVISMDGVQRDESNGPFAIQ
jgi:hypothetical protein